MKKKLNQLKEYKIFLLIGTLITTLILLSLLNEISLIKEIHYNFALTQAKESINKDIIYLKWAALEGGVYVPISEYTPPNPYLNVPNKIVETKEGLKLTLVNHAYMTRMVYVLEVKMDGIKSKITSLNPINPISKPDEWEKAALTQIEKGNAEEKHELKEIENKKYLRYIQSLKFDKPCLSCHQAQGYKLGDIRGGISVSIPYDRYNESINSSITNAVITHLTTAVFILVFLFVGAKIYRKKNKETFDELNKLNFIVNTADIGFWEINLLENTFSLSENWSSKLGHDKEEFKGQSIEAYSNFLLEDERIRILNIIDDIRSGKSDSFSIEHRVRKSNGEYFWVLTKGFVSEYRKNIPVKISGVQIDIDADKKITESLMRQQNLFKEFVEISPIPFIIAEFYTGKIIYANKAAYEALLFSENELIGKSSIELNIWLGGVEHRNKVLEEILVNKAIHNRTMKFRRKDDKIIEVFGSVMIIEIDGNKYLVSSTKDVTEENKFHRLLKKEKELYSYFNYLFTSIDTMSDKEFYDLSIEYLVNLTDSKYGFFHRVSDDQKEIILTTWNSETKEFCNAEFETHYPVEQAGNWTDCLNTREVVIYNDYKNSPNQKGLPIGHVQVEKFMSVATYVDEKPYLIFGVGNKEEDYDEIDSLLLKSFSNELSKIIVRKQYINQIKEHERFLSTLINNLPGLLYRCANDKNWTMYYITEKCEDITGYKPEELINNQYLSYNDLILPDYQKYVWEEIQNSIEKDLPYELEYQIIRKDGSIIWVWERGKGIKDNNGNLLFLEGLILDNNQKKKLEIQLHDSSEKYRLINENIGDVISVLNLNFEYLYVSPSVKKIFGFTQEEIYKLGIEKTLFPEYVQQFRKLLEIELERDKQEGIDKSRTLEIVFQQQTKDGKLIWVEGTASFLRDTNGNPTGILIIMRDVSKKKELENLLVQSERKYRLLFEETKLGIAVHQAVYDESGKMIDYKFLDMNSSFEKILSIHREDFIGKTVLEVLPNTEKHWIETYEKVVKTGEPFEYENYSQESDKYFYVLAYNNEPDQFAVIIQDITENKKTLKRLEESESKLRLAQKYGRIGHYDFDIKTGKWTNSEMIDEIYGIDENYVCNVESWLDIVHPDDREMMKEYLEVCILKEKNEFNKEYRVIRKSDKKLLWVHVIGTLECDENGEPAKIFGTIQDITDRKKAEEEQLLLNNIIDNSNNEIYIFDSTSLKFEYANKSALKNLGYSLEELKNLTPLDIKPKLTQDKFKELLDELTDDTKMIFFETVHQRKNGTTYPVEVNLQSSTYNNNKIYFAIINDITNRKEAEKERLKLSTAVGQSRISVLITDINGNIEYVNNYFLEKTGYSKEEVLGKNPKILSAGKHSKNFYKQLWSTILLGNTWEGVFYNKKKNGQLYYEHAVITPIRDQENRIVNFVAVKEDITEKFLKDQELLHYKENLEKLVDQRTKDLQSANERLIEQIEIEKQLKKRLNEALTKEKETNALKTQFFAAVSHEFRIPLSSILSSAQMMRRYGNKWSPEKLDHHYVTIDKMISHITKLLDDIMLICRTDREILKNSPRPEDITLLFNEIIEEQKQFLPKDRSIKFINNCSKNIYNLDKKIINHIVGNLLNNAIKYGFEKTDIDLIISQEEDDLVVQVKDKGIGITEDDLKNIFEPFYRANNSLGIKGTGLGLNIVKRCVDLLNGIIEVESKLNEGTKFKVRIPLQ